MPIRVAIVEDDPVLRASLERVVQGEGDLKWMGSYGSAEEFMARTAGLEGLDVVLMDIQMPEMNGYEAAKAIRALPGDKSRIPIIAMSANVMKAEVDRCLEAGMNAFVPKPYKKEQLLSAIERMPAERTTGA